MESKDMATFEQGIVTAINTLKEEEGAFLEALYRRSPEDLRSCEKQQLMSHAIELPVKAQHKVKEALTGYPMVNLLWQVVNEQIQPVSYAYIDWDSFKTEKMPEYERKVSATEFSKAKNGMNFSIIAGCLTVGSIALVCLLPTGFLQKVFIVVSVIAAAATGYCIVRAVNAPKRSTSELSHPLDGHGAGIGRTCGQAIEAAHHDNNEALKKWCTDLKEKTLEALRRETL